MQKKGIMIKIIFNKEREETTYFCSELNEKEVKEDCIQRIKSVLVDLFTNNGKKGNNLKYGEMVERIHNNCNAEDMLVLYEKIIQKFQHSNMWDIVSDLRIDQQIGSMVWIIVNVVGKNIVINDVRNDFYNLMDDIIEKSKKKDKKMTKKEMKIYTDNYRNTIFGKIIDNGCLKIYFPLVEQKPFEYNGEWFIPIFKCIKKPAFDYMMKWSSCDPKEDRTFRGGKYNYKKFIKADDEINPGSTADIYLCFTDKKMYVPSERTLFEYWDKKAFGLK